MRSPASCFGILMAFTLAGAAFAAPIEVATKKFERHTTQPAMRAPAAQPFRTQSSVWTWLGPNQWPGRSHCATPTIFNIPNVDVGTDGCGYFFGYAFSDFNWDAKGDELGGGVLQMSTRLDFSGPPVERRCVIRGDGQLFYSDDDGATWTTSTLNPFPDIAYGRPRKLGMDSGSINVCFLLVEAENTDLGQNGFAVMRSFDGGASWDLSRFDDTIAADLWCSRIGTGQIVLAYQTSESVQLEVSTDLADTWTQVGVVDDPDFATPEEILVTAQETGAPDQIWVAENGMIHRSTDGGANWAMVQQAGDGRMGGPRGLCASVLNPDLLLWTADGRLHMSRDGGVTDSVFANDWPTNGAVHGVPLNIDCWTWTINATGAQAPAHHVRRSGMDAGAGGEEVPNEERFFIATGGGTYLWEADQVAPAILTSNGFMTSQYHQTFSRRNGHPYDVWGGMRDVGAWGFTDFGAPPLGTFMNGGITSSGGNDVANAISINKPFPLAPFQWYQFPNALLILDGDGLFTGYVPSFSGSAARFYMLTADPASALSIYFGADQLYRVTYDRNTDVWSQTTLPTPPAEGQITGFAIAPSNPNRRYLSTALGNLHFTTDGGANWTPAAGAAPLPIDPDNQQVQIVVHPTNPLEVWACGDRIQRSTNGGVNWTTVATGLPGSDERGWDLSYDGTSANQLYLAAPTGAYRWGGASWIDLSPPGDVMPALECRAVEAIPYRAVMRYATWGRGVFDYATGSTLAVNPGATTELRLAPGTNPMSGRGRIDFTLPRSGRVTLDVFDVRGRRVARLLDGEQPAGPGSAFLDTQSLAAGVYLARLASADGERTAKVVIAD